MDKLRTGWSLSRVPQRHARSQIMGVTGMELSVKDGWRIMGIELRDIQHASFEEDGHRLVTTIGLTPEVVVELLRFDAQECELRVDMQVVITRSLVWLKHTSAEEVTSVIPCGLLTIDEAGGRCIVRAQRTCVDIHGKPLHGVPADGVYHYMDASRGPWLPRLLQAINLQLPLRRLSWKKY